MTESIIVAVITGAFAVLGTIISNKKSASLIEYRLEQLEQRVDSHNSYAKMFSESMPVLKEQYANLKQDMEELKREKNPR